jgi:hypothetical protein
MPLIEHPAHGMLPIEHPFQKSALENELCCLLALVKSERQPKALSYITQTAEFCALWCATMWKTNKG